LAELIRNSEGFLKQLEEVASPLKRAGAESLTRNALMAASSGCDGETLSAIAELAGDTTRPEWLRVMAGKIHGALNANSPAT
ncbi:MAG: hypothetical protein JJU11_00450, partial [Candidatus Sumerlaeia bacterium]|nr:hypothetical protein [Candidatus Sumerlaeia bacterium]